MLRRRVAILALAVFGVVGVLFIPSSGSATPGLDSPSTLDHPSQPRCDPQPDHGQGPPDGKGTKKCASP